MTELSNIASVPRLGLRAEEAPAAIGVSPDHFRRHIAHELKWVRRGRVKIVSVAELSRWLEDNAERVFGEAA